MIKATVWPTWHWISFAYADNVRYLNISSPLFFHSHIHPGKISLRGSVTSSFRALPVAWLQWNENSRPRAFERATTNSIPETFVRRKIEEGPTLLSSWVKYRLVLRNDIVHVTILYSECITNQIISSWTLMQMIPGVLLQRKVAALLFSYVSVFHV